MNLLKHSLVIFLFAFISTAAFTQDARLAQQYFVDGEYEKAANLYERLFANNERNDYYFDRYIDCLKRLEDYNTAEKAVKKLMRKQPSNVKLFVVYGGLLEQQYKVEDAEVQYDKAIQKLPADRYAITKLANAFLSLTKYNFAIQTYEKGEKLLRDPFLFAFNLAELHRRNGDETGMINEYLNSVAANPSRMNSVQSLLQRYLPKDKYDELKTQLYERIQDEPEFYFYSEMLTWLFVQEKDYKRALRQVRALDRRLNEGGGRVYQLAGIAYNDKDYDAAIDGYEYLIKQKGVTSVFYIDAKQQLLRARRNKIVDGYDYERTDLLALEQEYESFLEEFGGSKRTARIILELAELEALYLNNLGKATNLLAEMIEYPGLDRVVLAEGKLQLADYYLMQGEIWEATLLYSQVDKAFKDDALGHEARYKNARLSFFAGDFQWAQAQFDVLKASTSKLIANDALDRSVFIMDNLALDTIATPLEIYADAELLIFQNKFDTAFNKLDSLTKRFPSHDLEDDVLYLKAQVHKKKREYVEAANMLQAIVDNFKEGIKFDNSLFELAELYELRLNDTEKAKALYETLFIDYSGSTFAVEARKRYRILRGDEVQ